MRLLSSPGSSGLSHHRQIVQRQWSDAKSEPRVSLHSLRTPRRMPGLCLPPSGIEPVRIRSFELTPSANRFLKSRRDVLGAAAGGLALSLAISNRAAGASSGIEPPLAPAVPY